MTIRCQNRFPPVSMSELCYRQPYAWPVIDVAWRAYRDWGLRHQTGGHTADLPIQNSAAMVLG